MCALARGCAIEELGLSALGLASKSPDVSDFAVRALAEERHAILRSVDLSGCRVTDAAVHALTGTHGGGCCIALHTLRLSACGRLTDAGVQAATRGLPALMVLAVDGCAGVSAGAVAEALAARPLLEIRT